MIEEKYADGESLIHRLDTRSKIVAAVLFATTVASLKSVDLVLVAMTVSATLILLSRIELKDFVIRMCLLNIFTLLLILILPFTYGGETTELGGLQISREGLGVALLIAAKTNTIVPALIALLCTCYISDFGHALYKLKFPKKLCFILLFSYRYVFVIYQEYTKLLRAAKMRNFSPKTNIHTYRTFGYLFGMTLVKSYNRSQRVHQAMQLRGFNGQLVSLHSYHYTFADLFFLLAMVIFSLALFLFAIMG